jgi:WD40 repeat protein
MKRLQTALAVALFSLGVLAGCNDYNYSVQGNTGATLTNISPSGLPAGTPTGGNLTNCPNTPSGQSNPCFTLFAVASAFNGFLTTSTVRWNGVDLPVCSAKNGPQGCTTYIDGTDLSAAVPYSFLAKPGNVYVDTLTPQTGSGQNGLSNALTFIVYGAPNPFPTLSGVSPNSTATCSSKCANVSITVTGTNFIPTSQNGGSSVTFTGAATGGVEKALNVTSISSTQIVASIPGGYFSANDTAKINVMNPQSAICVVNCPNLGGGDTNCTPTIPEPSNCTITTQTFTIGSGAAPSSTSAAALAVAEESPAVSQDGRYVAYASVQSDTAQILLRDTCLGAANGCTPSTRTVSAAADGTTAGNGDSHNVAMTPDARYVAFTSAATNLTENAPSGRQVYLHDTCIGAGGACKPSTLLISTDTEGKLNGTEAILPSISTSGRFVAFLAVTPSQASAHAAGNKIHADAAGASTVNSGLRQVFVRDTCLGAASCTPKTTRISLAPGDTPADATKPAGPALGGLAKQIALSEGKSSTVFTPTVPIDDRVFLAIPNENK